MITMSSSRHVSNPHRIAGHPCWRDFFLTCLPHVPSSPNSTGPVCHKPAMTRKLQPGTSCRVGPDSRGSQRNNSHSGTEARRNPGVCEPLMNADEPSEPQPQPNGNTRSSLIVLRLCVLAPWRLCVNFRSVWVPGRQQNSTQNAKALGRKGGRLPARTDLPPKTRAARIHSGGE